MSVDPKGDEMLRAASEHFREPVVRLRTVCEALWNWKHAVEENVRRATDDQYAHGHEYAHLLTAVFTDIEKSALLYRLLYMGEPLRTEMCPEHRGTLAMGIHMGMDDPCPHGCDGSGWLPGAPPESEEGTE